MNNFIITHYTEAVDIEMKVIDTWFQSGHYSGLLSIDSNLTIDQEAVYGILTILQMNYMDLMIQFQQLSVAI